LLTIIGLAILFRRRIAERITDPGSRQHDVALFTKADNIIDEPLLDDLLNHQLFNHWCERDAIERMGRFRRDFVREQNQYLHPEVRRAAHDLIDRLTKLDNFCSTHFFTSPTGDGSYRLYPEMRNHAEPEMRARYWDRVPELNELSEAAWTAYRKYRATVKKRLRI